MTSITFTGLTNIYSDAICNDDLETCEVSISACISHYLHKAVFALAHTS